MTDIDKVLAEEGVADAQPYNPVGNVPSEVLNRPAFVASRTATQFTADSQPLERQPFSAALRRRGNRRRFDDLADAAYEAGIAGSVRHMELVRDSLEGKPGVRIADGEWNPDQSPQFAILQQFAARFVAEPQTQEPAPSGLPQAADGLPEG